MQGEHRINQNSYISVGLLVTVVVAFLGAMIFLYNSYKADMRELKDELTEVRSREIATAVEPLRVEIVRNSQSGDLAAIKLNEIAVTLAMVQKDIESLRLAATEMLKTLKEREP